MGGAWRILLALKKVCLLSPRELVEGNEECRRGLGLEVKGVTGPAEDMVASEDSEGGKSAVLGDEAIVSSGGGVILASIGRR